MTPAGKHRDPGPAADPEPQLLRTPPVNHRGAEQAPGLLNPAVISTLGLLVIFLILQFVLPARLVIGGMGAAGRPSVAVGVLLAFLWVLSAVRPHRLPGGRQPIRWAVGLFFGVQLLGYAVGFDRLASPGQASAGTRWLIVMVAMAGVILAVADGIRTKDRLDALLRTLVFLGAVMSVVGILQFFGIVDLTRFIRLPGLQLNADLVAVGSRGDGDFARVAGTAAHYIEFGVVLALLLPIAVHYALHSPAGMARARRWTLVGLVALGIPLSISRSAVITVLVSMALLALIWPWRQRYNALVIGFLATAAFHVLNRGVLGTIKALFTNLENDPSVQDRIDRTTQVMALWHQRPVLGWGAGMVTPEEFLLLDNQVYMFLIASGVVGVVAFLVLFATPYFLARSVRLKGRDPQARHLGQALAATMPAAVIASGTFDSFSFATFVATMSILIGAAGALWRLEGGQQLVSRPLQAATPGDRFVTTPLMARNWATRWREAWAAQAGGRSAASPRAGVPLPPGGRAEAGLGSGHDHDAGVDQDVSDSARVISQDRG